MRLLLLLILCLPAVADPAPVKEVQRLFGTTAASSMLRVERDGQDVRLMGDAPLKVRTRRLGTRMRVDVSPAGSLACKLPEGIVFSRPESGTLRLEWRVPPLTVSRCVRAADGRAVRLVLGRARAGIQRKTMSQDFINADLVDVIKVLAKRLGHNVYIGPGVEGSVTVTLKSVPAEGALAFILQMQESDFEYKVVSNGSGGQTLIVAPPAKFPRIPDDVGNGSAGPTQVIIPPGEGVRQEILLEKAPAAKVMEFLQGQYKNVLFTAHPTMNGFYVYGVREDVLQIKSEVPNLDRIPEPPPPQQREFIALKYGDINEIKSLLATLVPDVQYAADTRQNTLILDGAPGAIEQVKELLAEFDRPSNQVVIDCKTLALTPAAARTGGRPSDPRLTNYSINVLARTPFIIVSNLQFLISQNEAKLLESPRFAVDTGQEVALRLMGRAPMVWFGPAEAGLTVVVRPTVQSNGYLNVDFRVSVNLRVPGWPERVSEKAVRVKDGDTIIVSGVITPRELQAADRYPALKDVPHLGPLLREAAGTHREIVLMLTPHIMK